MKFAFNRKGRKEKTQRAQGKILDLPAGRQGLRFTIDKFCIVDIFNSKTCLRPAGRKPDTLSGAEGRNSNCVRDRRGKPFCAFSAKKVWNGKPDPCGNAQNNDNLMMVLIKFKQ